MDGKGDKSQSVSLESATTDRSERGLLTRAAEACQEEEGFQAGG